MLTSKQRAYLRSLAVNEDTILMIGKGGIDGDVVKQAADAIFKRELIKGKVLETAPVSPREAAEALAEQTESEVVQVIGSKFALYKRKGSENRPAACEKGISHAHRHLRRHVQSHPHGACAPCAGIY